MRKGNMRVRRVQAVMWPGVAAVRQAWRRRSAGCGRAPRPGASTPRTGERGWAISAAGLKLMAGELGVPVLLLSELNRKLEDRPDKRPSRRTCATSGS
ncbi:hypothetical protein HH299_07885, partial [Xanthomonas sp. Kuri4-2]